MISKQQLRIDITSKRRQLDLQWLKNTSADIEKLLLSSDLFQSSDTVALYMAISGEVDLESFFKKCWNLGKRTCIPVFNDEIKRYEMAEISEKTHFKRGRYGIKEPSCPVLISKQNIDLMAVPGVAFDLHGNRLGRGGGFYDCLINNFSGKTIGVAFEFQLFNHIPTESHDQPVDFIITESKLIKV